GVLDAGGAPLSASYLQAPGFTTRPLIESISYGPAGSTGESAGLQPLTAGASIPSSSVLVVRFTEPMNADATDPRRMVLEACPDAARARSGAGPVAGRPGPRRAAPPGAGTARRSHAGGAADSGLEADPHGPGRRARSNERAGSNDGGPAHERALHRQHGDDS